MRSFTIARAAVLPLFGLLLAACSLGGGDEDLALGREDVSGVEKGGNFQAPSKGEGKGVSLAGDEEFVPVEGDAGHVTGDALSEGSNIEGKGIEHPLPTKGDLPSKGHLSSESVRVVNSACPMERVREVVGNCVEALTYAKNPETGECCVYARSCDVPRRWDRSFSAEAVCR
ncbi:hypothetical protein [Polyangium sp. 6x1]|uniref:hypothetical protein n=1 Tax=Polyangium sp. 6x1 TaxID=3042689 RepID=UPI00248256DC|nr:hypothetical protein [Polyangium sp. 6x1]MDI1444460.1 hypothetical protein [Polyangium sp. 6x1]